MLGFVFKNFRFKAFLRELWRDLLTLLAVAGDLDFLNSKSWCHNMEEYVFKNADLNKDGYICSEDRDVARRRFRDFALKKQHVDERALEAHEAATKELESAYGKGSDRVSKDDWLKKVAELAAADLERIKKRRRACTY